MRPPRPARMRSRRPGRPGYAMRRARPGSRRGPAAPRPLPPASPTAGPGGGATRRWRFMTARATPKATATAASRHARWRTSPVSAPASPRQPATASSTAAVHSRSPVTAAGGIWVNSRAARPAPTWTETTPVRTSAEAGTARSGAGDLARVTPRSGPWRLLSAGPGPWRLFSAGSGPWRLLSAATATPSGTGGQRGRCRGPPTLRAPPGRGAAGHHRAAGRNAGRRRGHPMAAAAAPAGRLPGTWSAGR